MTEETKSKTFVLSDESLNSYGFWVKTNGIDLKQFKKNPIMLWGHHRTYRGTTDEVLPIGIWENIRVEEGKLLADAVFDLEDEFAKKIASKVERGILRMCSVGIDLLELDATDLKPKQSRSTVSKSKLREVSIVDIGSNDSALVLYDQSGKRCELSAGGEIPVALLHIKKEKKMEEILKLLKLEATATEAEIAAAIAKLQAEVVRLTKMEADLATQRENRITAMVDTAIKEGKLTADKKEAFLTIGKTAGEESLQTALSSIGNPIKPSAIIGGKERGKSVENKKWHDYTGQELVDLKKEDLERYAALYQEAFGMELKDY